MKNKPKIVVFSAFYSPYMSGAELFVKELVERLADKYDFCVITSRLSSKLKPLEIEKKYTIRRVGFGFAGDKFLFIFLAPLAALKYKPKIVHAVMESYAGVALWFFRFLNKKIPTVLTLQSGDLDDPKKQRRIPNWLWQRIHLTPDRITAISSFLAKRAKKLGFPKEKISIVPNGVDLKSAPQNISQIPFRIICLARLSWEKGINYLIEAMTQVKKEFAQAHLVLVGDGPERKKIEERVKKLNLEKSVEFKGKLSHQKALRELAQSVVFVCPSLAEGLGIVFLEAMAVKVPIIGTPIGGIPDFLKNRETGLFCQVKNPQSIAEKIKELLEDQPLREQLTENAYKLVERKYSWDKIVQRIADIYDEIIT